MSVSCATALNVILGCYHLGTPSLWLDESYTWLISSQSISSIFAQQRSDGGHLFLYYVLLHFLISWFGSSPVLLRLPSVIAGAAAVPLVYVLTCRLASDRVAGLYASWLFAVSAPLVFWQQNAREYTFMVLCAVASALLLVIAVQSANRWWFVAWAALIVVACYTNPEAAFLPAAQLLPFLVWPRARVMVRPLAVSIGAAIVAVVTPIAAATLTDSGILLSPPHATAVKELASFLSSSSGSTVPTSSAGRVLLAVTAVVWVVGAAMVVVYLRRDGRSKQSFGLAFSISWLVVPPLVAWAISEIVHPIFADRYLIVSLPAAAVVVGIVLARVRPIAIGIVVVALLMVLRVDVLTTTYNSSIQNFSGATLAVAADSRPGDCITFYLDDGRMLYDYYAARSFSGAAGTRSRPRQVLPGELYTDVPVQVENYGTFSHIFLDEEQTPTDVAMAARTCSRLWLLEVDIGSTSGLSTEVHRRAGFTLLLGNIETAYHVESHQNFAGVALLLFDRREVHSS